jgi:phage tail-like protein
MRNPKLIILGLIIIVLAIGIITIESPEDTKVARVDDEDLPLAAMSIGGIESDARKVEMMSVTPSKFSSLLKAPLKKYFFRIKIQNEMLSVNQVVWVDAADEIVYSGKDFDEWDYSAIKEKKLGLSLKGVSLTTDPELADWLSSVDDSTLEKKPVTLIICDAEETEIQRITLVNAYPVRWEGPDPKAEGRAVTIQCIEFKYRYLEIGESVN